MTLAGRSLHGNWGPCCGRFEPSKRGFFGFQENRDSSRGYFPGSVYVPFWGPL